MALTPVREIVIIVAVVLVAIALVTFLAAGRSKMLKCPNCGTVFRAPIADNKLSGLGWTFPYLGRVKCPKCGESRGRRDYQKAPREAASSKVT